VIDSVPSRTAAQKLLDGQETPASRARHRAPAAGRRSGRADHVTVAALAVEPGDDRPGAQAGRRTGDEGESASEAVPEQPH
jgi:hypothetical protein